MMLRPIKALALACWTLLAVTGVWAGAALGSPERSGAGTVPVAISAEIAVDAGKTRLAFVLSKAVAPRAFVMERPDRVIVDLPEVNFQLPGDIGRRRAGVVSSFRYGLFAPGRSRVVIDLVQPALVAKLEVTPRASDGAALLRIELGRSDREAFHNAAAEAAAVPSSSPDDTTGALAGSPDRRPLVMIDAGHGGIDPGAVAPSGVLEKEIVLGVAQSLAQRLGASGRYRVNLTRTSDVFVSLGERVRMARASQADLFISIHADSIPTAPHVHGGTVYTGSERATDEESASLADRENKADAAAGLDSHDSLTDVSDILQDLTIRETRTFSHRFADKLLGQLGPVLKLSPKPRREAGFKVLRSPDVPSVLVELGYLSNRLDLEHLLSAEWRERAAAAIASSVDSYFGARAPVGTAQSAAVPAPVSP